MDSVTQAGPCARSNQLDFDDEVVSAARQKLFDLARSRDRRAFCLVVSMTHPHDPYAISEAYWNLYRDAAIDAPRVADLCGQEDPHSRRLRHVIGLELAKPTAAQVCAARRAYYGAISYVDVQIGVLVKTLKETAQDANTIIVVLADHGDMLGERGLWYKMNFFEPACRIPFIVSAPGRFAARRVPHSASLVDLLPTFVALAHDGAAPDYALPPEGRSLLPALEGHDAPDEAIGEYLAEGAIAPIIMIRRGRYKFVHSPVDPDQLYDIAADPDERINLAPEPVHAARLADFHAEVARRWQLSELHSAVLASQEQRHFVYAALREGRYQPWDFQPLRDASRLYIRNHDGLDDQEDLARLPPLS